MGSRDAGAEGSAAARFGDVDRSGRLIFALIVLLTVLPLMAAETLLAAEYAFFDEDEAAGRSAGIEARPAHARGGWAGGLDIPGLAQARRYRRANLNRRLADRGALACGDVLQLNLFEGRSFSAVVDRVTRNVNGTTTVRARLADHPLGYVLISTTDGRSLATVVIPEKREKYLIRHSRDGRHHYLLELDDDHADTVESLKHPVAAPVAEEVELQGAPAAPKTPGPMEQATVDIMIVYTPAAKSWAGGATAMANVIAQAVEKAQLVLDNSGTLMTLRLVHSAEISYTESGDSSTDLTRLRTPSDGYMDQVIGWRDTYGADIVSLFARVEDTGGTGYLLTSASGSSSYAFNLSRVQQVGWTYTHIHEVGHNLGLHHHKLQNVQPGPGLFSYSAGWRWTGTDAQRYCCVMTYDSGSYFPDGLTHTRVAYLSNPSILYQGAPTGHSTDGDNARTTREIKHVIAAYRSTPPMAEDVFISGVPSQGHTLTGNYTFSGGTDLSTFRWLRAGTAGGSYLAIAGATARTYVPTEADFGKFLKFEVTPRNSSTQSAPVTSDAFGPIGLLLVSTALEVDWVYQNNLTTQFGHQVMLSATVANVVGDETYTLTISDMTDAAMFSVVAGADSLKKNLVGGTRNVAPTGTCNFTVTVTDSLGRTSGPLPASLFIRHLGDIDGNGFVEPTDKGILNSHLNGVAVPGIIDKACDLDANGFIEPTDKGLLNNILNGVTIN